MNKYVREPEVESERERNQYLLENIYNINHLRPETFEAPEKSMGKPRDKALMSQSHASTAWHTAQHSHMVPLSCQGSVKRCRNWYNILYCVASNPKQ